MRNTNPKPKVAVSKQTNALHESQADVVARLRTVEATPDAEICLTDPDAPLVLDWSEAQRGRFYKPAKRLKSFRIDADVLAWFEAQGKGYQAVVNRVLREAMLESIRSKSKG